MVEIPTPHYLKPGHRFDSGPIILDLYRLLSLVLAEKQVSALIKAEFDGFRMATRAISGKRNRPHLDFCGNEYSHLVRSN